MYELAAAAAVGSFEVIWVVVVAAVVDVGAVAVAPRCLAFGAVAGAVVVVAIMMGLRLLGFRYRVSIARLPCWRRWLVHAVGCYSVWLQMG